MFSLFGAPALSQFRLDQSLRALRRQDSRVAAISSRWLHFVDAQRPLADSERRLLEKLLTYGPRTEASPHRGQQVLVTPRVGTESPWSSKATDIVHVCGLDAQAVSEAQVRAARRAYYGAVSYVDDQIGVLLSALTDARFAGNTVVLLLADHGDMLGERGLWYKMNFFEPACRIPGPPCEERPRSPRGDARSHRGVVRPVGVRYASRHPAGATPAIYSSCEPHGMVRATARLEAHGATSVQVVDPRIAPRGSVAPGGFVVCPAAYHFGCTYAHLFMNIYSAV